METQSKLEILWKTLTDDEKAKIRKSFEERTHVKDGHLVPKGKRVITTYKRQKYWGAHVSLILANRKLPLPHEQCYTICDVKGCLTESHLGIYTQSTAGLEPVLNDWIHARWLIRRGCELDSNGHLLWNGEVNNGYGTVKWFGTIRRTHRLALMAEYQITGRALPPNLEDLFTRHGTGCPKTCCDPDHLQWGTPADNNADQIRDGLVKSGDDHPRTKYKKAFIEEVKATKGQGTNKERAIRFGIPPEAVENMDGGRIGPEYQKVIKEKYKLRKPSPDDYQKWAETLKSWITIEDVDLMDPAREYDSVHHICEKVDANGYGRISIQGKMRSAHRASLTVKLNRPLLKKEHARHLCLRKDCFNPNHLKEGTAFDNAKDKKLHGTDRTGEKHPHAVVSDQKIAEIRKQYKDGSTVGELEKEHGINYTTIRNWVKNRNRA